MNESFEITTPLKYGLKVLVTSFSCSDWVNGYKEVLGKSSVDYLISANPIFLFDNSFKR